jgi:hypothetical protein
MPRHSYAPQQLGFRSFRLVRDPKLRRLQPRLIEAFGQFRQCIVAARPHLSDDGVHFLVDLWIEQTRGRARFAHGSRKIRLIVSQGFHAN